MSEQHEGVQPDSPTDPDPNDPDVSAAAVSAVDVEDTVVGDRPLKNIIAELDRKNEARLNAIKAEMLSALGTLQRPAPAPTGREYSDEELAQLSAAGDARAHDALTERKAARYAAQHAQAHQIAQNEQAQLGSLLGRYPVLRDASHPLTQYAMQVKSALLTGGAQNTPATVIESIKTAIADNPDLAAQSVIRTTPAPGAIPRPSAPTAAAATPSARRPAPPAKAATLTDAQWTVAKRYGYKTRDDAAKAVANFERRQASGQSRLGAVGSMVREDS